MEAGILGIVLLFPLFIMAVVAHEVSHGWVALQFGDPTALQAGRLTLNPFKHIDLFGTILLPLFLFFIHAPVFGWAKPVPINPQYMRHPKHNILWVGLAGPATNFLLALIMAFFVRLFIHIWPPLLIDLLRTFALINLVLGTFNLIPLPPLDGSRVMISLLPIGGARLFCALEPWGILIIMLLCYFGFIDRFLWPMVLFLSRVFGL